jgi:hypothetical protein
MVVYNEKIFSIRNSIMSSSESINRPRLGAEVAPRLASESILHVTSSDTGQPIATPQNTMAITTTTAPSSGSSSEDGINVETTQAPITRSRGSRSRRGGRGGTRRAQQPRPSSPVIIDSDNEPVTNKTFREFRASLELNTRDKPNKRKRKRSHRAGKNLKIMELREEVKAVRGDFEAIEVELGIVKTEAENSQARLVERVKLYKRIVIERDLLRNALKTLTRESKKKDEKIAELFAENNKLLMKACENLEDYGCPQTPDSNRSAALKRRDLN